jgi:hypothetical protein
MCAMSSNAPGPRPRQVTIGGWVVAVASAMLVASVFDSMAGLQSVDTRDALTKALTTGAASGLGISVDDALGVVRVALYVAAVAAAVTGILGIFVLQRHAAARIVLTIAAVPVVLTAPVSGGVLALLIGGGTALLWSEPARDWFAGRPPSRPPRSAEVVRRERPAPGPRATGSWTAPPPPPSSSGTTPQPPPTSGFGQRPVAPSAWPPPSGYAAPAPYAPGSYSPAPARAGVPTPVRVACILTWIFSLLTAGLYVLVTVALLVDREQMLDLLRDNPTVRDSKLDADQLVTAIVVVSGVVVLWCLAACVLAVLAWRRHAWAWILLTVSVGLAALVEVVGLPYSLLHLIAAGVALRMLLLAPTRAWFRGSGPAAGPPDQGWAPPAPPGDHSGPPEGPPPPPPSGKPPVW